MTTQQVVVDLGYRPRPWQQECRAALKRFSVLVVHRRGGKTVMSVATLVDAALRTRKKHARYAYIAPQRNQAKAVAWDYLKRFATLVPGCVVAEGELHVTFPNGAQIRLFGADDPDSLRGLYFDGAVVDEVADMKPQTWGEVLRPALSDRKGWALFIGTPKGTNLLSEMYHNALAGKFGDDWYTRLLTIHDTDALDADEIAAARAVMSDAQFRQEFLCDFSASSDNQLITLDMVNRATTRLPDMERVEIAPRILGVDVARYGDDRCVIARRQGPLLMPLAYYAKIDNMEFAAHVARAWEAYDPDACFIDNGRGEGVIDRLRQLGFSPVGVDFGGTQGVKPGYRRKRDEMWGEMAEWVDKEGCLPDDPELRAAMTAPTYSWGNVQHSMELESKEAMRKRGLPSPDPGDAVGLTFAFPVMARSFLRTPDSIFHRRGSTAKSSRKDFTRL